MKRLLAAVLAAVPVLFAASAAAQTQIGGGVCSSSTLKGNYALSLTGRQVNSSGAFLNVMQSNGTAMFDGESAVALSVTEDTQQAVGTTEGGQGTYAVQANCTAVITVGAATFNLAVFNSGRNFSLTGTDATYSYSGSGNLPAPQSLTCSNSTLNGMYPFNGTGFALSGESVSGVANLAGFLKFDGQGNLTVHSTIATIGMVAAHNPLTGTYTISSNCLGTALLTDSNSHSLSMAFSIFDATAANTNFFATLAQNGVFLVAGGGRNIAPSTSSATCGTSTLNGTYALNLSGRAISASGNFAGSYQGIGTATFDGNGNVKFAGVANTNLAQNTQFSYAGTYTVSSDCSGTLSVPINGTATFSLLAWGGGSQFAMVGSDGTYTYSASASTNTPPACATSTLSGVYTFTANGFTESGTTQNGVQDQAGVLQFDGQGNVTASYVDSQFGAMPKAQTATGKYTVGPGCSASATLTDSSNTVNTLNFLIEGPHGETADMLAANSQYVRAGAGHSAFTNPSQAIANVASYAYSATPPGSVFALFGQSLATAQGEAVSTPLPTKLVNTTVTVNGEPAPLFFVDSGQIDAQMPWDIPGDAVATVIVTNGMSTSNAAAVYVPAAGTPGISTYGSNRAVVVNADGKVNSAADQAGVGDEVVVYFTGGGPVISQINLISGHPAGDGLSPLNADSSITVGSMDAHVDYIGLTPGSIGLYQANFNVPQLAKGAYPVVITISGYASNGPVMNVN